MCHLQWNTCFGISCFLSEIIYSNLIHWNQINIRQYIIQESCTSTHYIHINSRSVFLLFQIIKDYKSVNRIVSYTLQKARLNLSVAILNMLIVKLNARYSLSLNYFECF